MTSTEAPKYHTYHEIMNQPAAWQDALAELDRKAAELRSLFQQRQPDQLLYVGCGSPYFLARSAASVSRAVTGIDSHAHPGSDIWLFTAQTLTPGRKRMMIVVSRSGETTELMKAIETFRGSDDGEIIAVTCYETSTLARRAEFTLSVPTAQEIGLAQTRSFTSMLLLTQGLIHSFADRPLSPAFRSLPDLGRRLIDDYAGFAEQFGGEMQDRFERYYFLGGGTLYGLACEAMLKMKEMSLSLSEAYHFMEFRHGPMSMANSKTLIIGMVSEAAADYEAAVLIEMRRRGATVLAITPKPLPDECADMQVQLPGGLTDVERGALYLPTLHQIIYAHTLRKGLDPDLPNNLTAVINLDGVHHAPIS